MSTISVCGREQLLCGETVESFQLELPKQEVTARELIRSRVFQQVKDFNIRQSQVDPCTADELVPRTENERLLNGRKENSNRTVQWQAELERALLAFNKCQIMILVDGQQLVDLDDEVLVTPDSDVSFLRLTMLAGG